MELRRRVTWRDLPPSQDTEDSGQRPATIPSALKFLECLQNLIVFMKLCEKHAKITSSAVSFSSHRTLTGNSHPSSLGPSSSVAACKHLWTISLLWMFRCREKQAGMSGLYQTLKPASTCCIMCEWVTHCLCAWGRVQLVPTAHLRTVVLSCRARNEFRRPTLYTYYVVLLKDTWGTHNATL